MDLTPQPSFDDVKSQLERWPAIAQALGKSEAYAQRATLLIESANEGEIVSAEAAAAFQQDLNLYTTQLNTLRDWYRTAMRLGKSPEYLQHIQSVGESFKQGTPVSPKAIEAMKIDLASSG
ncbi:MAG TPA: hypothetical protein V6D19_11065 [Stenomitos sp.]